MESIKIKNWEWHIKTPDLLDGWFDTFREKIGADTVKSNSERDVFRITGDDGKKYIVKYSHPASLLQKTRSSFAPKLKSEFDSIELLKSCGIPVAEACGWGRCGSESMLITKEITDAEDVRKFWFGNAIGNIDFRNSFLAEFADFLSLFLAAGIYHPDFHPGNIMVSKNDFSFSLIDPYGVTRVDAMERSEILEMLSILGAFRGELPDNEAVKALEKVNSPLQDSPESVWMSILEHETAKSHNLWKKRRKNALNDPRNSQIFETHGMRCRIRKSIIGELMFNPAELKKIDTDTSLTKHELSSRDAEKLWMNSIRLQIHRLPHPCPVIWITDDTEKNLLYTENAGSDLSEKEIEQRYNLAAVPPVKSA